MDLVKLIGKSYKTISMVIKEEDVVPFSKATKQEDEIFFNKIVAQNAGFSNATNICNYLLFMLFLGHWEMKTVKYLVSVDMKMSF